MKPKRPLKIIFFLSTLPFLLVFLTFPHLAIANYPDGYYKVYRIIDGDTFELTDGKRVRLIGIDTPETGDPCSNQAAQQLTSLIGGQIVYLEKDVSETDRYDKLLRYVHVNGTFVNYQLVYNGYAYAVEYPPDITYASQLAYAEENARDNKRGCLWVFLDGQGYASVGCFIATVATGHI